MQGTKIQQPACYHLHLVVMADAQLLEIVAEAEYNDDCFVGTWLLDIAYKVPIYTAPKIIRNGTLKSRQTFIPRCACHGSQPVSIHLSGVVQCSPFLSLPCLA